jgi:hypothetical protein
VNLYDVYNDKTVVRNSKEVIVDLPVKTTAIYYLGTEEQWKMGK